MPKKSAWLLHLIGDMAPSTASVRSEVVRAFIGSYSSHTGNGGFGCCLSTNPSWPVKIAIQKDVIGVARLHRVRYSLSSLIGKKGGSKELMLLRVGPTPTWTLTNILNAPMDSRPVGRPTMLIKIFKA